MFRLMQAPAASQPATSNVRGIQSQLRGCPIQIMAQLGITQDPVKVRRYRR
jgi:hypothetical protein